MIYRQAGRNRWQVFTVPDAADPARHRAGVITKTTGLRILRGPGFITTTFAAYSVRNRKLGTAGSLKGALSLFETENQ